METGGNYPVTVQKLRGSEIPAKLLIRQRREKVPSASMPPLSAGLSGAAIK